MPIETLIDRIFVFAVGALISFFITSISTRGVLVKIVERAVDQHAQSCKSVDNHTKECTAPHDLQGLKLAVGFLVLRNGGNPKDFGLTE